MCPNRQRKPKLTQNKPWKVRQVAEEDANDESDTEGNLVDNNESDDEFQINVTQTDLDSYNMDF